MNPYDSTVIAHSCVSPWRRRVLLVTQLEDLLLCTWKCTIMKFRW